MPMFSYTGLSLVPGSQTTLVDLYSKCGKLVEARPVFDKMAETTGIRDIQLWNTMIAGHAEAGDMEAARSLFE